MTPSWLYQSCAPQSPAPFPAIPRSTRNHGKRRRNRVRHRYLPPRVMPRGYRAEQHGYPANVARQATSRKSGADCGAPAWWPCAPQPACHRIELWCCGRRRGTRITPRERMRPSPRRSGRRRAGSGKRRGRSPATGRPAGQPTTTGTPPPVRHRHKRRITESGPRFMTRRAETFHAGRSRTLAGPQRARTRGCSRQAGMVAM